MPKFIIPLLIMFLAFASDSKAYVVIDNFQTGVDTYGKSANSAGPRRNRPTGVVADENRNDDLDDQDYVYPGDSGNRSRNARRSRPGQSSNSITSNRSRGGGGGGGVGSSGGFNRNSRRDGNPDGFDQKFVDVNKAGSQDRKRGSQGSRHRARGGRDVTKYGSGSGGNGRTRPRAPSRPTPGPSGGGGGPTKKPTATPEPAALAIWAIAGSCGYGLLRFRHKWLPVE